MQYIILLCDTILKLCSVLYISIAFINSTSFVVEKGLAAARKASSILYDKSIENLAKMEVKDLLYVFEGVNVVELLAEPGINVYELAMKAKCFKTNHDAKRIIGAGGFYINYQKITNTEEVIVPGIHILSNNVSLLRVGKKTYHVVRWL